MLTSLDSGKALCSPEAVTFRPEKTVCISGHREKSVVPYMNDPNNLHITRSAVKMMLYRYIDMALEKGYTDFISGLAEGTDLWAAEYILMKKEQDPELRLIGAMPFLRHSRFFHRNERALLKRVEKGADQLILINSDPNAVYSKNGANSGLYKNRNYFMVDNSSAVIAFFDESNPRSGTGQTVHYALRRGRIVRTFGLCDIYDIMDRTGCDFESLSDAIRAYENIF